MELRDAWAEGDGDRVLRCWKLFLPHFKIAGCRKYCLEALRLMFQVNVVASPNLAHQIQWHRFVNVKGGLGRNIPCDFYNEHVNKLVKRIICNMGPNLTEKSLQRAARSVSALDDICQKFDVELNVPCITTAHHTRSDLEDVKKTIAVVLQHKILAISQNRTHRSFPKLHLNPLDQWDVKTTKAWIKTKKSEYMKFKGDFCQESIIAANLIPH